jgi:hypothetical protein
MTNRSKAIGTAWENAVVDYLRDHGGRPFCERRAQNGINDRGDITGLPAVVIEAKAAKSLSIGAWLKELDAEIANDLARSKDYATTGALWIKTRGKTSAGDGYIVMRPDVWLKLLKEAGY